MLSPGLGLGLSTALANPALVSLFANGEDGFLFGNWSELDELLTTSVAPPYVAVDNDPVGLALDDRSWGVQARAEVVAAKPNLAPGDPSFDTGITGYTLYAPGGFGTGSVSNVDGKLRVNIASGWDVGFQATVTGLTVGRTYRFRFKKGPASTYTNVLYTTLNNVIYSAGTTDIEGYFVAAATSRIIEVRTGFAGPYTGQFYDIDDFELREVPGNHALQATTTQRPLWKLNGGKPYLNPDGSDDRLVTPFVPTSSLTLAVAARWTNANTMALGGGHSAGGIRAFLGLDASGFLNIGWGGSLSQGSVDRRNSDFVAIVTGGFNDMTAYVDGAQVLSSGVSGGPGGGGPIAIGAYNNNGTPQSFMAGNIYAALALNRRATPAEIGLITRQLQRTYQ